MGRFYAEKEYVNINYCYDMRGHVKWGIIDGYSDDGVTDISENQMLNLFLSNQISEGTEAIEKVLINYYSDIINNIYSGDYLRFFESCNEEIKSQKYEVITIFDAETDQVIGYLENLDGLE